MKAKACFDLCGDMLLRDVFVMFKRLERLGASYKTVKGVPEVFPVSLCSFTEL